VFRRSILRVCALTCTLLVLALASRFAGAAEPASPAKPQKPITDTLLLKDYRPRSIYRIPQTHVALARFPVIDMHSHAYARDAAQVRQWVQTMDQVGIEKTVVMVPAGQFEQAQRLFSEYPHRFEVWCSIEWSGFDRPDFAERAIARLEQCVRAGARGVGELVDKGRGFMNAPTGQPDAPGLHLDDPRMDPILRRCGQLGLPVSVHVGEDQWEYEPMDRTNDDLIRAYRWRIADEPGVRKHDEMLATLERAVRKHPGTTFIACHFANCCTDLSLLAQMLQKYPNLYADTGARFGQTASIPRYMKRFFERWQDRLLYGTDAGMSPQTYRATFRILETEDEHFYEEPLRQFHWPLHGFGLSEQTLKKVYSGNARRIMQQRNQALQPFLQQRGAR